MEQNLRCNNQIGGYCRAALTDEAVVTTCSHIFCISCAKKTGFARSRLDQRTCPVCRTALPNNDDAVQTRLAPSEDYKTSVLSGLDPTTVMECASRAMAFWNYQTTQEIFYQEHLCKNLTDKYTHLSTGMDNIIKEANTEIQGLQTKMSNLAVDYKTLQKKYDDLAGLYRDKSSKHAQAQKLYDALKKKYLMRSAETAASENVAQTVQAISSKNSRPATYQDHILEDAARIYGTSNPSNQPQHGPGLVDDLSTEFQQARARSQASSDLAQLISNMAPPARTAAADRTRNASSGTPMHRTALPGASRHAANRSQIPLSTSRASHGFQTAQQSGVQKSPSRHYAAVDASGMRSNHQSPRMPGGLLSAMKVGRAGTAGDLDSQNQQSHHESSQIPGPFHRQGSTFGKATSYH